MTTGTQPPGTAGQPPQEPQEPGSRPVPLLPGVDRRVLAVRMARTARSAGFRYRRQLIPVWGAGIAWTAGAAGWKAGAAEPVVIVTAALTAVLCLWLWLLATRGPRWLRTPQRLRKTAARAYLAGASLNAAWITLTAALAGPSNPATGIAVAAAAVTAMPWWWRNRPLFGAAPAPETGPEPAPDPVEFAAEIDEAWRTYVAASDGPLPGSEPGPWIDVDGGIMADITLRRGKITATSAIGKAEQIASALGEAPHNVILERHPSARAHMIRVTIFSVNPLHIPQGWPGPSLDLATGEIRIGPWATGGLAVFRAWAPLGGGQGAGALHSLICGTTRSGKSQFLLQLALEYLASGVVSLWAADMQHGASIPEILEHAHRPARTIWDTMEMLRAAERVLEARSVWMYENGVKVIIPSALMPMIRVMIDEAHLLLTNPDHGKEAVRMLEHIAQMGGKCGIGVDLVTQVPELAQLGGSEVLRSMLQAGNVVVFRTAGKMTADRAFQGILPVDPSLIPKVFPGGHGSAGTAYMASAVAKEAPCRTWLIAETDEEAARLAREAARFQAVLDIVSARAAGGDGTAAGTIVPDSPARAGPVPPLAGAAPAPAGRPASYSTDDVVLETLSRAGRPLTAAEVWDASGWVVSEWGRDKRYSSRSIADALGSLRRGGRICQDGERAPYYLPAPQPDPAAAAAAEDLGSLFGRAVTFITGRTSVTAEELTAGLGYAPSETETTGMLLTILENAGMVGPDAGGRRQVLFSTGTLTSTANGE